MKLILGIDDAGRGPVIGPIVLAGVLLKEKIQAKLKKLGVKDSKLLAAKKREALAKKIKEKALGFEVITTYPGEIDSKNGNGINLNYLEAISAAKIIDTLSENIRKDKELSSQIINIVIDCPSPNCNSWKNHVIAQLKNKENLIISCEHKADVNHISVSAASILAKVARDEEIKKLKEKIGHDFGSGYASDPYTKKFVRDYYSKYKHDGIFRETWGTIKTYKAEKEQKKLKEF